MYSRSFSCQRMWVRSQRVILVRTSESLRRLLADCFLFVKARANEDRGRRAFFMWFVYFVWHIRKLCLRSSSVSSDVCDEAAKRGREWKIQNGKVMIRLLIWFHLFQVCLWFIVSQDSGSYLGYCCTALAHVCISVNVNTRQLWSLLGDITAVLLFVETDSYFPNLTCWTKLLLSVSRGRELNEETPGIGRCWSV